MISVTSDDIRRFLYGPRPADLPENPRLPKAEWGRRHDLAMSTVPHFEGSTGLLLALDAILSN